MRHGNKKEKFETGAQRDTNEDKGRPSLISPVLIYRLGLRLKGGEAHYETHNYLKGMPFLRTMDSLINHTFQWLAGDEEEDHLAAIVANAQFLMDYEELIKAGHLDVTLDDRCKVLKKILPSILTPAPPDATLEPETEDAIKNKSSAFQTREGKMMMFNPRLEMVCPVCRNNIMDRGDMMCKGCLDKASYTG